MEKIIISSIIIFILLIFALIIYILLYSKKNIEKFQNNENNDYILIEGSDIIHNYVNNKKIEKYIQFNQSGRIILNTQIICDILIIGGGGGGGGDIGGGGGAGGVVYQKNVILNPGLYNIRVGNGGSSRNHINGNNSFNGNNGEPSSISYNNSIFIYNGITFEGKGGGGGGNYNISSATNGNDGGSGGGGSENNDNSVSMGGTSLQGNTININNNNIKGGNRGSRGVITIVDSKTPYQWCGGGGGGAGGTSNSVHGGAGIKIDIIGENRWYAAGGGGGAINTSAGKGGNEIGGDGYRASPTELSLRHDGVRNTGSGGGGGGYHYTSSDNNTGGAGGSGVIIIKYLIPPENRVITKYIEQNLYDNINEELFKYPSSFIETFTKPQLKNNYYTQTFLVNKQEYILNFSYYNENYINPYSVLFDGNTNFYIEDKLFKNIPNLNLISNMIKYSEYEENDEVKGIYTGTTIYNSHGINNESGEWISIKFPQSFILKKYGFIATYKFENCAPGTWKLYGRNNDNENFTLIDENILRLSNTDYNNNIENYYQKNIGTNTASYNTYLFIFKTLASSDINKIFGGKINFTQILLFGKPE